jgi:hypothetical protein
MNLEVKLQPVGQAGSPGKTTGFGLEVGVLRSSEDAPISGVERRQDTDCLSIRRLRPALLRSYQRTQVVPWYYRGSTKVVP